MARASSAVTSRRPRRSHARRLPPMPTFKRRAAPATCCPTDPIWTRFERLAADLTQRYGYRRIETPMLEQAGVFERGVGEVTDIVEKELFRISPRTEEAESWRFGPEPTAGIVRAYIQHGMYLFDPAEYVLRPVSSQRRAPSGAASSAESTARSAPTSPP